MLYDLFYEYDARERRIFDERHYLVGHGRNDVFYHLHEHDAEKYLRSRHAEHLPRFILSFAYALYPAAVYLRKIAGIIDYERDKHRHEARKKRHAESKSRDVENDHDLEHQGRAPDDPDHGFEYRPQPLEARHRTESYYQPEHERRRKRNDEYQACRAEAFEQRQRYFNKHRSTSQPRYFW